MIEIPDWIVLANATFQFDFWSGSLTPTAGTSNPPQQYGNGNIRIWNKDGDQPRSGNNISSYGNLVMDGAYYTAQQLGFTNTERTITLYVEGHSLGSNVIIVNMDYVYNGQTVRVTDTVKYEVQESHWEVTRDSALPTATAEAAQGDTILNLAIDIGLNPDEFKQWLTFTGQTVRLADGQYIPTTDLTLGHKLYAGQTFKVPNTIYMAWFGEGGSVGKSFMAWDRNVQHMSLLGFNVIQFDNDVYMKNDPTTAKWNLVRGLEILAENKAVHGLYMMGHGNESGIAALESYLSVVGSLWDMDYIDPRINPQKDVFIDPGISLGPLEPFWSIATALKYHLGAIIIQACGSSGSNAEYLYCTNGGFFSGKTGYYIPLPEDIAFHWGYETKVIYGPAISELIETFGGKQKTNTFSVSTFTIIIP